MTSPDELHRTIKLELDEGRAATVAEAEQLAATYRLNVVIGRGVAKSATNQAVLLTVLNCAVRAFRGGVAVSGDLDWTVTTSVFAGGSIADVASRLGAQVRRPFGGDVVRVTVGDLASSVSDRTLRPTWNGWAAGVATTDDRLDEREENPVSGVLAAALAVSEAFQAARGSLASSRRDVGLSLWDHELSWRSADGAGPPLRYLPNQVWLPGLGHLGQAYVWTLGVLPFPEPRDVHVVLQDFDRVVEANRATGLLVLPETPAGVPKTRLAAAALERRGFLTAIIERPFDETIRIAPREPRWALAGFDSASPRRDLGAFDFAVDLGLGSGHDDYLAMHLHSFPTAGDPRVVFADASKQENASVPAWAELAGGDACGMVQLAHVAVGAAFVGAAAAALGVAELVRALVEGPSLAIASWDLRAPQFFDAVRGAATTVRNPGYQRAAI